MLRSVAPRSVRARRPAGRGQRRRPLGAHRTDATDRDPRPPWTSSGVGWENGRDRRSLNSRRPCLTVVDRFRTAAKEAILVALGVTDDGHKEILDVLHAPSESAEAWGTMLARLKMRGLDPAKLALVVTDGDQGVISALSSVLPTVPRQRCTVHKVRNVIGACPRGLKATAPKQVVAIYDAPSRDEAKRRAVAFIAQYETSHPRLAKIVEDDLDACLRFYDFDASRWRALRTTNALERINRELRRKLREVGAMKGGHDVTRIAVGVAQFVNDEMKGVPIDGFRALAKRKNRR
jgi:transposase-like protein